MLKALVTPGAYTSGNIPFTGYQNTNNKYDLNADNTFDIKVSGLTEIKANIVVTATAAGVLTLTALADGVPIPGAVTSQQTAIGSEYTLPINDIVKSVYQENSNWAKLSFQLSGACILGGGDMILTFTR